MKMKVAFLALIFLLAIALRTRGLQNSATDWHAFRQADTASVTREYVKHGVDFLHPHYHDLSNIQSGKDNLAGYRMVEFPLINGVIAYAVRALPFLDLVVFSRLVSVLFSLGTLLAIYWIGKEWSGEAVGLLAALAFAILPYSIFYSRVVLPEPAFLCFITASVAFFQVWLRKRSWAYYLLSLITMSLALLLKPFGLFLAPVFAVMTLREFGWRSIKHIELVLFGVLAVVPLYAWRHWILQFPSGIPASDWLFNGDGIRLRPAWFRWLIWERLTKLILGVTGLELLAMGLLPPLTFKSRADWIVKAKEWIPYLSWWLGILAYFIVIATGNVRHDYYQVFVLPIICLSIGRGVWLTYQQGLKWGQKGVVTSLSLIIFFVGVMVWFSDRQVRGYYGTRLDWETAGQAVDQLLPLDAKVIAPAFGDTAFLFQTNRTGWPIGFDIEDKIAKGAEYYVSTAYDDEARELEKKYQVLEKTSNHIIIKLQ